MNRAALKNLADAGTPVCIGKGYNGEPPLDGVKAVVVGLGEKRAASRGAWMTYKIAEDGVRIRGDGVQDVWGAQRPILGDAEGIVRYQEVQYEDTSDRIVRSRDIWGTWDAYLAASRARDAAAEARRQQDAHQERRQRALEGLFARFGITARPVSNGVALDLDEAEKLLALLEAHAAVETP